MKWGNRFCSYSLIFTDKEHINIQTRSMSIEQKQQKAQHTHWASTTSLKKCLTYRVTQVKQQHKVKAKVSSNIRRFHRKYRGHPQAVNLSSALIIGKLFWYFPQTTDEPQTFWNRFLWTVETKIQLCQCDEKCRGRKHLLMIQTIQTQTLTQAKPSLYSQKYSTGLVILKRFGSDCLFILICHKKSPSQNNSNYKKT